MSNKAKLDSEIVDSFYFAINWVTEALEVYDPEVWGDEEVKLIVKLNRRIKQVLKSYE